MINRLFADGLRLIIDWNESSVSVICTRRGSIVGVLHSFVMIDYFDSLGSGEMINLDTNERAKPANEQPGYYCDIMDRTVAAHVLAGWQFARSKRRVPRKTYVFGRDLICGIMQRESAKRETRHSITRSSASIRVEP